MTTGRWCFGATGRLRPAGLAVSGKPQLIQFVRYFPKSVRLIRWATYGKTQKERVAGDLQRGLLPKAQPGGRRYRVLIPRSALVRLEQPCRKQEIARDGWAEKQKAVPGNTGRHAVKQR